MSTQLQAKCSRCQREMSPSAIGLCAHCGTYHQETPLAEQERKREHEWEQFEADLKKQKRERERQGEPLSFFETGAILTAWLAAIAFSCLVLHFLCKMIGLVD